MQVKVITAHKNQESAGFNSLPHMAQERIKHLLLVDFRAAKALYDQLKKPNDL